MRIVPWLAAVVRGDDVSFWRVEGVRQLLERNIACPFVLICPAWDRDGPVTVRAHRNIAWHLVSNIAIHICVDKVLGGDMEAPGSLPEVLPVLRLVEAQDRLKEGRWHECGPLQGDDILLGQVDTRALVEGHKFRVFASVLIFQRSIRVRNNGSVPCEPDGNLYRVAANDLDGFCTSLEVHPFAIDLVLVGIVRVDALDVEVHDVGTQIRHAPGDPVIVTDHDPGNACEGKAGYVVRAFLSLWLALEVNLVPDRGHLDSQVRVVCQQWHARCGP